MTLPPAEIATVIALCFTIAIQSLTLVRLNTIIRRQDRILSQYRATLLGLNLCDECRPKDRGGEA